MTSTPLPPRAEVGDGGRSPSEEGRGGGPAPLQPAPLGGGTSGGLWRRIANVFLENHLAVSGIAIIVGMVLFCFVGPVFYRTNQVSTDIMQAFCPPSGSHLLGCDGLGYDQLGRLMAGGQTSLEVGFAAAFVSVTFGTLYGAFAGFAGGIADALMMRVVDAGLAIPGLLLLIILSVIFHPNTVTMIFIIAALYWFGVARLVRGETLSLRTREYVQAVKVSGGGQVRSVVRHVLPNAAGTIIVQATFAVADAILILAGLGFLGLGVEAPATDWGSMLSSGLTYLEGRDYWWLIYPPGLAIIITCVAFNTIGDGLRDAFETRLQRR